jgi:hypothetical protein
MLAALAAAQSHEKRVVPFDAAARQTFDRQMKVAVLVGVGDYGVNPIIRVYLRPSAAGVGLAMAGRGGAGRDSAAPSGVECARRARRQVEASRADLQPVSVRPAVKKFSGGSAASFSSPSSPAVSRH